MIRFLQKKNPLEYVLPAVYGLFVFLFFWKIFPHHLHYHEQFQLFLFTQDYFIETCSRPGGFCNYAGRFFTQFFLSSFIGALIVSCFLTGIQQLAYAVTQRFRKHPAGLFLSFLPSLFYWHLLCNVDSRIGGTIALLLTLLIALIGTFPKSYMTRRVYLFVSIPVLYWIAGGAAIVSMLLLIGYEWYLFWIEKSKKNTRLPSPVARYLLLDIAAICLSISLPYSAKFFLKQYTINRFWWGVDYIHFVNDSPSTIIYIWVLIFVAVAGVVFLPEFKKVRASIAYVIQIVAFLLCIYFVIVKNAYPENLSREEIMAYDYHSRMQNWDKIIEMADRKSPTLPMTVTCLNLALYKTGQLPEKMFHYFQNGPEGLLPTFQRDFMIPMVGGEPYYYLGFVNTAQRFAFEAMEAIPDFQKSVRSIKRLTETNLINGYYDVASKYLHILENTLFYRNWAKETKDYLYDDARIDAHPEWGEIRRFQIKEDFIFSGPERDMMLGIFFQQSRDNRMAYEYLMAYALLTKDLRGFFDYFHLEKKFSYPEIPKSYQEALIYLWGLDNNDIDLIPLPISPSIKQRVTAYANTYTSMQSPEPVLRRQFSNTYWYYLHFRNFIRLNETPFLQYE
jgi:hypothetical protein